MLLPLPNPYRYEYILIVSHSLSDPSGHYIRHKIKLNNKKNWIKKNNTILITLS